MTDKRDDMTTPLSEEQIAEIRELSEHAWQVQERDRPDQWPELRTRIEDESVYPALVRQLSDAIDASLAEIKRLHDLLQVADDATQGLHDLAGAAIEHLRAQNVRLREIVAQVVVVDDAQGAGARCAFCGWRAGLHRAGCARNAARALLEQSEVNR